MADFENKGKVLRLLNCELMRELSKLIELTVIHSGLFSTSPILLREATFSFVVSALNCITNETPIQFTQRNVNSCDKIYLMENSLNSSRI